MAFWRRSTPPPAHPVVRIDSDVCTELVAVVGEAAHQPALERISQRRGIEAVQWPCEAQLYREPDNPFDPRAVAVFVECQKVGYLSRGDALDYGPLVEGYAPAVPSVGANIAGRGPGSDTSNLGVFLLMPPPE